jgi:hypothetical protein
MKGKKKTLEEKIRTGTINLSRERKKIEEQMPTEYAEIVKKEILELSETLNEIDKKTDFRTYATLSALRLKLMNSNFPAVTTDEENILDKLLRQKKGTK